MPLREYKCKSCGFIFEVLQKSTEKPLETCESCGGKLVKLLASPAIQFKGKGWYITDYARKNPPVGQDKAADQASSNATKPAAKDTSSAAD